MPRGRKPKDGIQRIYEVKLYLWEEEDDDLIAFLESLPKGKRASGIKLALRNGGTLTDLQSIDPEDEEDNYDFDLDAFSAYI